MSEQARITSVKFTHFKGLRDYSLSLREMTILVGPNNCGKSTLISAFRTLAVCLRMARSKSAQSVTVGRRKVSGHLIRPDLLPLSLENVHSDYEESETRIDFVLSNSNTLTIYLSSECAVLTGELAKGGFPQSPSAFIKAYPIVLTVVPVLGPLEHKEKMVKMETVRAALSTHRACRHFRNYWYYFPEGFEDFAQLIKRSWQGMEIEAPELSMADSKETELVMFCKENRITREVFWAGFGFQIWCQLLTHIVRASESSLLVLDEPEIYLHPDVQRQLVHLLRNAGPDILMATHSSEIMADAEPNEIVFVDKRHSRGRRLADMDGIQQALKSIGSIQNITLTHLAKNRCVLLVEDYDDFRLVRLLARKFGASDVASGVGMTVLRADGFGAWRRVAAFAEDLGRTMGTRLRVGVIVGRGYRCDEQIQSLKTILLKSCTFAHVYSMNQMENYLLVPGALDRAVAKHSDKAQPAISSESLLRELTETVRPDLVQSLSQSWTEYYGPNTGHNGKSPGEEQVSRVWSDLHSRLALVPGKDVLAAFRSRVAAEANCNLTDSRIVDAFRRDDFHPELKELFHSFESFAYQPA